MVEKFAHCKFEPTNQPSSQSFKPTNKITLVYKTLDTSIIYSPMSPPSQTYIKGKSEKDFSDYYHNIIIDFCQKDRI